MPPVNVLVMIHGMSPDQHPRSPFAADGKFWGYNDFWNALKEEEPKLASIFPNDFIGVEWGHELPALFEPTVDELRQDQRLTRAQNFVNKRISYNQIIRDSNPNNVTMSLLGSDGVDFPWLTPMVRALVVGLRETIMTRGFSDVVYYCSEEGERQVRCVVYGQVLKELDPYLKEQDVRIHLIGQSLGVTLTHDFLYGLFSPLNHKPGYLEQGEPEDVERFDLWRQKAHNGELKLGSLTSTASQLPLFVMRKNKLVTLLAKGEPLDARDIGITSLYQVKWKLFYDVDDILGFSTRRLYNNGDAIMEFQVDSGDNPGDAHVNYWKNETVIQETAKLLLANASAT